MIYVQCHYVLVLQGNYRFLKDIHLCHRSEYQCKHPTNDITHLYIFLRMFACFFYVRLG